MTRPRRLVLVLDSRLDELDRLNREIEAFCAANALEAEASRFNLCAEELAVNAIVHGFQGEAGHPITVQLTLSHDRLEGEITDSGPAFDPTANIAPDLAADIETREIGGLGRYLVSTMMDTFCYRRDGEFNRVTFGRSVRRRRADEGGGDD